MPDFENLPDDDEIALLQYIEEFTEQYQDELKSYGDNEDTRQVGIEFMNNVLSAASALGIVEFSNWSIPEWNDAYKEISDFKLFTKAYVIRAQVKRARTAKVYTVLLDAPTKERIHGLITAIRRVIQQADIEERKRNSLYAKLNVFEADVDRSRTRFDNAMAFIIDAADAAKKVGESLNPLSELVKRINELLGHAKDLEGDIKLPPPIERKRIEGPKKVEPTFSRDLDEDIPF
ncbi:hypothetical protein [Rhizobium sp. GN54]|uniref:hypothetical protein n=1 Tax=Rhizobium sp. GN54 TaxID=2898150 RepID=UPI001E36A6E4|nr:hypothetical protein [Rhizobium sp. GN54]MCD2183594.1 hypothetical protein [Rhizobium sp. GN54]